jgi:hypothetical protein
VVHIALCFEKSLSRNEDWLLSVVEAHKKAPEYRELCLPPAWLKQRSFEHAGVIQHESFAKQNSQSSE